MKRFSAFVVLSLAAIAVTDVVPTPQLAKSTLLIGGQSIAPTSFGDGDFTRHVVNGGVLEVREKVIRFTRGGNTLWDAKAQTTMLPIYLASNGQFAFFEEEVPKDGPGTNAQLLRLDLVAGKWIEPLTFHATGKGKTKRILIVDVACNGDQYAVLVQQYVNDEHDDPTVSGRYVASYRGSATKQLWQVSTPLPSTEAMGLGMLWSASLPNFAYSRLTKLQFAGGNFIVCADAESPITWITPVGKIKKRLTRIWEYRRGFVGPSVWSNIIIRNGSITDDFSIDAFDTGHDVQPKVIDKSFVGSIIAGPIWVHSQSTDAWRQNGGSFFIATSIATAGGYEGYRADCVVYEVDQDGRICTRTPLSQLVNGGSGVAVEDGVVWTGNNASMLKMASTPPEIRAGSGPGGPDLTGVIPWFTQRKKVDFMHVGEAHKADDVVAYTKTKAYRLVDGWYCDDLKSGVVNFPIRVMDLMNGQESSATLRVPLGISIHKPESNYSGADERFSAAGPYMVGVTHAEITNGIIRFMVATEKMVRYADFRLP